MTSGSNKSVAVTGMGVICSVGRSVAEFEAALRKGRCGISALDAPPDQSVQVAGIIRDFSWQEAIEPLIQDRNLRESTFFLELLETLQPLLY